jgi:hypothetical protein
MHHSNGGSSSSFRDRLYRSSWLLLLWMMLIKMLLLLMRWSHQRERVPKRPLVPSAVNVKFEFATNSSTYNWKFLTLHSVGASVFFKTPLVNVFFLFCRVCIGFLFCLIGTVIAHDLLSFVSNPPFDWTGRCSNNVLCQAVHKAYIMELHVLLPMLLLL